MLSSVWGSDWYEEARLLFGLASVAVVVVVVVAAAAAAAAAEQGVFAAVAGPRTAFFAVEPEPGPGPWR